MRAVVMCGGLGTRLRPLTLHTPKAMLPVAGRPVIDRLLEKLAEAGVRDVTLATGYLAEVIEDYVQDGARWGLRVDYVRQVQPMGTAGALSLLADKSQPVLVVNGDKVFECADDLRRMARTRDWIKGKSIWVGPPMPWSVSVGTIRIPMHCGVVLNSRLVERPVLKGNAGVYTLSPVVIRDVPSLCDMPDLIRDHLVEDVALEGYVLDIGTPESYEAACARLS